MTQEELNAIVKMNIYQRIHAIMAEAPPLPKNKAIKNNKTGTVMYKVVQTEDLDVALKPLLEKYRVVIVPTIKTLNVDRYKGKYGDEENHATVNIELKWVNIDKSDDYIVGEWYSVGIDNGDKAIGKAITYAMRIGRTKQLNISTGDPEPEETHPEETQPKPKAPPSKPKTAPAPGIADANAVPPDEPGEFVHRSKAEAFLNFANALKLDLEKDIIPYLKKNSIDDAYHIPTAKFELLRKGLTQIEKAE